MKYLHKKDICIDQLPGRGLRRAIGKQSEIESTTMTVGYAMYSSDYGIMEPHHHAEETVIITKAKDGWVSWGETKENLSNKIELRDDMILHFPENEWHVFTYGDGGYVEIIFIYGSTDNLRPEDKQKEAESYVSNNERNLRSC